MFPIFDLTSNSGHYEISDSGIINVFLNPSTFLSPLFFCSFIRFFVSYILHISFKIRSDMFLTIKPSYAFFMLTQTSPVFLLLKCELLHFYILQLMLDTFYIHKNKKCFLTRLNHQLWKLFTSLLYFLRLKNQIISKKCTNA